MCSSAIEIEKKSMEGIIMFSNVLEYLTWYTSVDGTSFLLAMEEVTFFFFLSFLINNLLALPN